MTQPGPEAELRRALIYALGGGLGHRTRGGALAQALASLGVETTLLVPGPGRRSTVERVRTWEVSRTADVVSLRREVDAAIEACAPDLFIVDALPDGVLGELDPLPSVGRTAALLRLHRGVANGQLAGMLAQYDLQLDLEAPLGWCAGLEAVGPIVSKPAMAPLEVDVALVASDAALAELFGRVAPILEGAGRSVRLVDAAHEPEPFDVSCARVVIGAAGYNLTWECAGAGVFHLAVPRPRRFDDQFRRATEVAERPHSPEVLVDRALALTAPDAPKRAPHPVLTPRALAARLLEQ